MNEEQIERLVRDPLRKLKDADRLTDWFQRRKMQPSGTWDVSGPGIRLRAAPLSDVRDLIADLTK